MTREVIVYQHLKHLGAPVSLKGYKYLQMAVQRVLEDREYINGVTGRMYPEIANAFGTTPSRVERDIRYVIETVFQNTEPSVVQEYFGNLTNATTGKLTNTQFIAGVAELIRMEELM